MRRTFPILALAALSGGICHASDGSSLAAAQAELKVLTDTIAHNPNLDPSNPDAMDAYMRELVQSQKKFETLHPPGALPVTAEETEKLSTNLAGIKQLFERAEAAFKVQHFHDASLAYKSVSLSSVKGSEDLAARSRDRLIEIDGEAKDLLRAAGDKELRALYTDEVRELEFIVGECADTGAGKLAVKELARLRSLPAAEAYLDLEDAKAALQRGKLADALKKFNTVAGNPKYHDTIAAVEAHQQAKILEESAALRLAMDMEESSSSEHTAQKLLARARNLLKSNANDQAAAALTTIVTLHPDTPSANEAKKLLEAIGK